MVIITEVWEGIPSSLSSLCPEGRGLLEHTSCGVLWDGAQVRVLRPGSKASKSRQGEEPVLRLCKAPELGGPSHASLVTPLALLGHSPTLFSSALRPLASLSSFLFWSQFL